jgi:hypothetical protein
VNTIWAGTDDGLIHITRNGGTTWQNVTPPALKSWAKVSLIDAGRFDANTAYAAINTFRLDDLRPHIYRTHDGGRTWKEIVKGLPNGGIVNAVREDPERRGLLYCGTEQAVYFSLDDGENWQPLRLNMPATSIRDLVVHKDDLVVGTHGRSFWILDDTTPLRQINAGVTGADAYLFAPQMATRVKRSVHTDTPFPPEEPAGQNPPDGAIINYYLKAPSRTPIALEIYDAAGKLVRRYASDDKPLEMDPIKMRFPRYWVRPPQVLKNEAGMQRFTWDLMYPNPPADEYDLPISAIYKDTPLVPQGPAVLPGKYTVKLIANGKTLTQTLTVRMDPRVTTSAAGLNQQFALSMKAYNGMAESRKIIGEVTGLREGLEYARKNATGNTSLIADINELDQKLGLLLDGPKAKPGALTVVTDLNLKRLPDAFNGLLGVFQDADVAPSTQAVSASSYLQTALSRAKVTWNQIKAVDAPAMNVKLAKANITPIQVGLH